MLQSGICPQTQPDQTGGHRAAAGERQSAAEEDQHVLLQSAAVEEHFVLLHSLAVEKSYVLLQSAAAKDPHVLLQSAAKEDPVCAGVPGACEASVGVDRSRHLHGVRHPRLQGGGGGAVRHQRQEAHAAQDLHGQCQGQEELLGKVDH